MERWGLLLVFVGGNLAAQGFVWSSRGDYAGAAKCALCHPSQARSYQASRMRRAMEPIESCQILQQNPRMAWSDGPYRYLIEKTDAGYRYSVTNGAERAEAMLRYALGQGKAGQTYVFEKDGRFYESRASYYRELKGLGLTVGAQNSRPVDILQALGQVMSPAEARDCFGCHTTAARRGNTLQLDNFESGVQCEDCHGPGAAHIAGIADGKSQPGSIRSLKGLDTEATNDLCGSCHRTWETIMLLKIRGPNNVRFQPYRLTNSRCFLSGDRRIACTGCHDPHTGLQEDAKTYDSKCVACHKQTCKVAAENCVSCHMPRYEPPGSHHLFADHFIRVVRPGEPYPD